MVFSIRAVKSHNKNINDRQQSWLDAQTAARPLYWRYVSIGRVEH